MDSVKVMAWLEKCGKNRDCSETCPYTEYGFGEYGECRETLMSDALDLIEKQNSILKLLKNTMEDMVRGNAPEEVSYLLRLLKRRTDSL